MPEPTVVGFTFILLAAKATMFCIYARLLGPCYKTGRSDERSDDTKKLTKKPSSAGIPKL